MLGVTLARGGAQLRVVNRLYCVDEYRCPRCQAVKQSTDFYWPAGKRSAYCKPCMSEYNRNRYVSKIVRKPCPHCGVVPEGRKTRFCSRECSIAWHNAKPASVLDRRDRHLKKTRGIGLAGYATLLASQDGRCKVCGGLEADSRHGVFDVDHCHDSDRIRGLLCHRCNWAMGILGDDPELLRKMADYLSEGRAASSPGLR